MNNIDEATKRRIEKYRKKKEFSNKYGLKLFVTGFILYVVIASVTLAVMLINESSFATPVGILMFGAPVVAFIIWVISIFVDKPKPDEIISIFEELSNRGVSALELFEIEKTYKVEAYVHKYVIEKRCKELGFKGVPEVCARDGIMPTEDMLLQK